MTIPLDPGSGGQSIDVRSLNIADIIVSTVKGSAVSAGIRIVSGSKVSHAMLYVGYGQVVEAIGSGVTLRSLDEALREATLAVSYRHDEVDEYVGLKIRDFAGKQIDKKYNYAGVAQQGVNKYCQITGKILCQVVTEKVEIKHDTFFCSELIWAAYADAEIKLTDTRPSWSKPGDVPTLYLRKQLLYVGHLRA